MYKVIIVDDEKLMRDALSTIVSNQEGFQVLGALESGEKAVEFCACQPVDIVFMDIMMPGIDGIEASKRIYAQNSSVTIYIISAYSNFEFAKEALRVEVREYITKPISLSTIRDLLNRYRQGAQGDGDELKVLLGIIAQNNFEQMYKVVPQVVKRICTREKYHPSRINNCFFRLGQSILNEFSAEANEMKCDERFPMNKVFGKEEQSWSFWLFEVMDYVFRTQASSRYNILYSVFDYINDNIKKDVGLQEITDACSISQGYLSRLFRQEMSVSVMDYIHMCKLMKAKMYFAFSNYSATEVAFRLGYNESSYFGKVFKKYEQMTVQQYKKGLEENKAAQ